MTHNHPFHDGNKRTGYAAAMVFLSTNGYTLQITENPEARVAFFEQVASGEVSTEELTAFYRDNTTPKNTDEEKA